jgi:hypothetical protein
MAGVAILAWGGIGGFSGILVGSLVHAAGVSPLYAATSAIGWPAWAGPVSLLGLAALVIYLMSTMCPIGNGPQYLVAGAHRAGTCGFVIGWLLGALAADWLGWVVPAVVGSIALTCTMASTWKSIWSVRDAHEYAQQ